MLRSIPIANVRAALAQIEKFAIEHGFRVHDVSAEMTDEGLAFTSIAPDGRQFGIAAGFREPERG